MPVIQPVDLLNIDVGSASNFRGNININFDRLKAKISEIIDENNGIIEMIENNSSVILSPTQPPIGTQKENDLWLREL